MAAYADETIELPCLGRPLELGMLYDCRNEKVVPGVTLWNRSVIDEHADTNPRASSQTHIIAEETFEKKAHTFDIHAELKLSLLCGLVNVEGSAKYLNHHQTSQRHARVSLQYSCKTFFQQLSMEQMAVQNIQYRDVFDQGTATHVVSGVQYGADAVFMLEREVEKHEERSQVEGFLKVMAEKIPKVLAKINGEGKVDINDNEKKESEKLSCTFYGDIFLKENPATYAEAIAIYKELPKLIEATGSKKGMVYGVPKKVFLYPLSKLDNSAAKLQRIISADIITEVTSMLEGYSLLQLEVNEMLSHTACTKVPGIKQQITSFKSLVSIHVSLLQQMLMTTLPNIRGGLSDEKVIAKEIAKVTGSPFNLDKLSNWLDSKKQEMACLEGYFDCLKDFQFTSEASQLDRLIHDMSVKNILVLHFGLVTNKSCSYLGKMASYQKSTAKGDSSENDSASDDEDDEECLWFRDVDATSNFQKSIKLFKSFAQINGGNDELKCVVSTSSGRKDLRDNPGKVFLHNGESKKKQFKIPTKPAIPTSEERAESEIVLQWGKPDSGSDSVLNYMIRYRFDSTDQDFYKETDSNIPKAKVTTLKDDSTYRFQVAALCEVGIGEYSDWSQPISTLSLPPLAESVYPFCEVVKVGEKGQATWYQLPLKKTFFSRKDQLQKFDVFAQQSDNQERKVILLVGATGSGKTTLINGLVNYMLGVRMDDNYRFQLINEITNKSQAESQTSAITAYTIFRQPGSQIPFTLTIIDTPGFGDTRGIDQDKRITDQIREFFEMKDDEAIDQLDAIGFVAPASEARLTDTQKYVFDSILSIFGKDIVGNIFMMLTFADGSQPPILDAIEAHKLPYQKYFKFNNSVFTLTSTNSGSEFDTLYWKLATKSFKNFFDNLNVVLPTSLKLTREVLEERKQLTVAIDGIQLRITSGVNHLETMRQHLKVIEQYMAEKMANKNFQRTVSVPKMRKIEFSEPNRYVTNCLNCHVTCHDRCGIIDDRRKHGCWAMNGKGQDACCRICKSKCHWSKHYNKNFVFEEYMDNEVVTLDDLKIKYDMADQNLSSTENIIAGLAKTYVDVQLKVVDDIETVRKCLARLDEIAMKPNPLTTVEYIDILIRNAQRDNKPGKQQRIAQLEAAKDKAQLIRKLMSQGQFDPFKVVKNQILLECNGVSNIEQVKALLQIKDFPEDNYPVSKPSKTTRILRYLGFGGNDQSKDSGSQLALPPSRNKM